MAHERLLKRMVQWQQGKKPLMDSYDLLDSIVEDVEKLLNSQRGNVLIDSDMGLSDLRSIFSGHGAPDLEGLQRQLTFQITEFEPRLTQVSLLFNEESSGFGELIWRLSAKTQSESQSQDLNATVKIDINGKVQVAPVA